MHEPRAERCETCTWWCRGAAQLSTGSLDGASPSDVGTCQNRTPFVVLSTTPGLPISMWPQTHANRFCGDWVGENEADSPGGEEVPVEADRVVSLRSSPAPRVVEMQTAAHR